MRRGDEQLPARRGWGSDLSPWSQGSSQGSSSFGSSPWQVMRRMQEDMDRIFGQFFGGQSGQGALAPFGQQLGQQSGLQQWAPSIDISQSDREWLVEVDLPGVRREDIETQIQDHHLVIRAQMRQEEGSQPGQTQQPQAQGQQSGQQQGQQQGQRQYHHRERRYGFFQRVLPLPENVDEENVRCEFRDGVLTIRLPKLEQISGRGRRIPIGEGSERTYAGAKGGEVSNTEQTAQPQQEQNPPNAPGGGSSRAKQ